MSIELPADQSDVEMKIGSRRVSLTSLDKIYFPDSAITKRELIQYYIDVSEYVLPHIRDRAMVMKRYPNGIDDEFFFMKRSPSHKPEWIPVCEIRHRRAGIVDYPVISHLSSLAWLINLGCIDLNPWYGRCEKFDYPDFLHFDLDPVPGADFSDVRRTALLLRDVLVEFGIEPYAKTTGSKGIHVYVAIRRGPIQKDVWRVAKSIARILEERHPETVTAQYLKKKRPEGRVLVDYNQNAWGKTLASVYSVRPRHGAPVSMPVTWDEVEQGVEIDDFTLRNSRERLARTGDLWAPLLGRERFNLGPLLQDETLLERSK